MINVIDPEIRCLIVPLPFIIIKKSKNQLVLKEQSKFALGFKGKFLERLECLLKAT